MPVEAIMARHFPAEYPAQEGAQAYSREAKQAAEAVLAAAALDRPAQWSATLAGWAAQAHR